MELSEIILGKIKYDHKGKENAITRKELLFWCRSYCGEHSLFLEDRKLRSIYSQLPVVACDKGIFWPIRTSEVEEFREYLKKKAIPLFERWKKVAEVHLSKTGQMELFG